MTDYTEKMTNIRKDDIRELISYFASCTYKTTEHSAKVDQILRTCEELFKLDYECVTVDNTNGVLCSSYPARIIIPEKELSPDDLNDDPPNASIGQTNGCATYDGIDDSLYSRQSNLNTEHSPLNLPSPASSGANLFNGPLSFSAIVAGTTETQSSEYNYAMSNSSRSERRNSTFSGKIKSEESTGSQLRELMWKARIARCRARFPVPTILCNGKYICRSSTLSGGMEMYGRNLFSSVRTTEVENGTAPNTDLQLFDVVRAADIKLLKAYNTSIIVDLMVENKKLKFGFNVTSSEKIDKENRYNEFHITSLPYPGCEFFKEFRDQHYNAEGLLFNWKQNFVDAHLIIPETTISRQVTTDWNSYRKWDLKTLSQMYLKLLLAYANESHNNGMLVHCISGWDRTPLFISLLRISLWADGAIHTSLNAEQMLYLTIAYDWFLFGHDLKDRMSKGEEIFFFCFYFLKHIMTDDYTDKRKRHISCGSALSDQIESLSSAGSSNSLNSTSSKSSLCAAANPFLKVPQNGSDPDNYNVNHTWPYGSFSDNDFDCLDKQQKSSSYSRTTWERSSLRENETTPTKHKTPPTRELNALHISQPNSIIARTHNNNAIFDHEKALVSSNGHSGSSSESFCSLSDHLLVVEENSRSSSSPVAVPTSTSSYRLRKDSSNSSGSWQLVSGTGSLKGSTGSHFPSTSINSKGSRHSTSDMVDSSHTIMEETVAQELSSSVESDKSIIVFNRQDRLKQIRVLFYNQFCSALGLKFSNRSQEGWGLSFKSFVS